MGNETSFKTIYHNDGIPDDLYNAFAKRLYDPGMLDSFISASKINATPYQFWLEKKYKDKMFIDKPVPISWAHASLIGDAMHDLLQKHFCKLPDYVTEQRMYYDMDIDGEKYTISGKFDLFKKSESKLSDYKTMLTKQYNFLNGDITKKQDAIDQLRVNKFLFKYGYILVNKDGQVFKRPLNIDIKKASIYTILNDWDKSKAGRFRDMPMVAYSEYEVNLDDAVTIGYFIRDRIKNLLYYKDCDINNIPPCNYEERWQRPSSFPVFKGNKDGSHKDGARALPGTAQFRHMKEALDFIDSHKDKDILYVEHREELPIRCSEWCHVGKAGYCPFWNEFKKVARPDSDIEMQDV